MFGHTGPSLSSMRPLRVWRHLKAAICQKHTAGWCHNWDQMPGLQTFSLALFIHNIQITAGHAGPRIYIEHKPGKNLQSRTLCIYEEEIHVQGMKNGTIFCEIASYINRGDSLSFMCPEPIIKIHTRVIAYYCQDYSCLLSPMMNEARINGIDFLKLHIIPAIAINLRHFTSLSNITGRSGRINVCQRERKTVLLQLHCLLLLGVDVASHLIFV